MNEAAWILAAALVVQSVIVVILTWDRDRWQERAELRHRVLNEVLARHGALLITLKLAGFPVPQLDVVDITDLVEAETTGDISWMPKRSGGEAS